MLGTQEDQQHDPALALATWADELRAMAAIGLQYARDQYDCDRYRRLQDIASEMLGCATTMPVADIRGKLAAEVGYVTVKAGVAAAVVDQGRLLLIRRRDNGLWAMPGGWADVGDSPSAMTAREVLEETGLTVSVDRLLGLYDTRKRGFRHPHQIYHLVFVCTPVSGAAVQTDETLGVDWFSATDLPDLSPGHADPVRDAFLALADPSYPTVFD